MKIRTGFVSNSSSTSFLVIAKDDLNQRDFFQLMGVEQNSPMAGLFGQLYRDVIESTRVRVDFASAPTNEPIESWFHDQRGELSPRMLEKLEEARKSGLKAYFGWLDSETSNVQTFFCTDSFEIENDKIYFNGLECVW